MKLYDQLLEQYRAISDDTLIDMYNHDSFQYLTGTREYADVWAGRLYLTGRVLAERGLDPAFIPAPVSA